jgi:hypothetical protein
MEFCMKKFLGIITLAIGLGGSSSVHCGPIWEFLKGMLEANCIGSTVIAGIHYLHEVPCIKEYFKLNPPFPSVSNAEMFYITLWGTAGLGLLLYALYAKLVYDRNAFATDSNARVRGRWVGGFINLFCFFGMTNPWFAKNAIKHGIRSPNEYPWLSTKDKVAATLAFTGEKLNRAIVGDSQADGTVF